MSLPAPAKKLDLRGLVCPMPDLRIELAMQKLEEGEVLVVYADKPLSLTSLKSSMEDKGYIFLTQVDRNKFFEIYIRK